MSFEIVRNDITKISADAVVNTVSSRPGIGSGADAAIHEKAGGKLLEARQKIGIIPSGEARVTPAFDLDAKIVIHVVAPVWQGGRRDEESVLRLCYRRVFELAREHNCESVAFPLLSAGSRGFPKSAAFHIAMEESRSFLEDNEMKITLVVFEGEAFELAERRFPGIGSYIDEHYVQEVTLKEYGASDVEEFLERKRPTRRRELLEEESKTPMTEFQSLIPAFIKKRPRSEKGKWDSKFPDLDEGFSETLLRLIDRTGKKDSEIYKKANVDRKHFSKIRNNVDYRPSKSTAVAFAVALELDLDETRDFLARAGFALSHSSKFDIIVEYFIREKNYDIFELNKVLFYYDQPLLGA